ncbi:hypothetical protein E1301_Tti024350 [Triplophysa tibetana]|uniref:Uncharacterized protein n=1 Tax=Triplophysa tibetana TaxID=1572043 RepID=A0A5A9MTK3_9TELE|nr:hypothetical protein E1301_Tti024350 [Triplophysa tibetana]
MSTLLYVLHVPVQCVSEPSSFPSSTCIDLLQDDHPPALFPWRPDKCIPTELQISTGNHRWGTCRRGN